MILHHQLMWEHKLYCARHGHTLAIDYPVEHRVVLCICIHCKEKEWIQLSGPTFQRLVKDMEGSGGEDDGFLQ